MLCVVIGLIALGDGQARPVAWGVLAGVFGCHFVIGFVAIGGVGARHQHRVALAVFCGAAAAVSAVLGMVLCFVIGHFLQLPLTHQFATSLVAGSACAHFLLLAYTIKNPDGLAETLQVHHSETCLRPGLQAGASKPTR